MPDPTPTLNKIKIMAKCDQSWENSLFPNDDDAHAKLPARTRVFMGFTEILGYLEACKDYQVIDEETHKKLSDRYSKRFEIEMENCIETGQ
jgi:hypothetical protein